MNSIDTNKIPDIQFVKTSSGQTIYFIILSVYAYGNFIQEIIPSLTQLTSVVRAIFDIILILIGIKFILQNENSFLKKILILLFIGSSVTFYLNAASTTLITHLNGLREPLVLIISLAILTSIFHSQDRIGFISKMNRFLIIFLVIQIPVAIYQFLRYGAGDLVGGTFSDGGSGMLSQVIFMTVYYLFIVRASQQNGEGFILKKQVLPLLLLIPVFINETKISFLNLAILLALQIKIQLNFGRIILSTMFGVLVMVLFVKILAVTTNINIMDLMDLEVLESYYFSDWSDAEDITRFGKLFLTLNDFDENANKHLFGVGYGLMKGRIFAGTSVAGQEYEYLYYGSRMMVFSTYIQGGIALILIYLWLNFYYFGSSKNTYYKSNFTRYRFFLFSIFILMWVYNDALLVTYFSLFAAYFLVFIKYGDLSEAIAPISKRP